MEEKSAFGSKLITGVVIIVGLISLAVVASMRYESRNPSDFNFSYQIFTSENGESVWVFDGAFKPAFHLATDQDYLPSVNRALEEIGLTPIDQLVEVTGTDLITGAQHYRWPDYELGSLELQVVECLGPDKNTYRCIGRIVLANE